MKLAKHFFGLNRSALAGELLEGHAIDEDALAGWLYRGVSLGMPAWVDRIAWKTFAKTFYREPDTGRLRGWNLRLEQTGLDGPIEALERRGEAFHFGHFRVTPLADRKMPRPIPAGLLLDYGIGGNPKLDPVGLVRDPIVAVNPGSADLLLGWTYLDLGVGQISTPSYFTLERVTPLEEVFEPAQP